MKGVLLTGGTGTRLKPYTDYINKHLLTVAGRPMVEYPLRILLNVGCTSIAVVYNDERIKYLSSTYRLTYIEQRQPAGIAQATYLAKDFVGKENFLVLCGDNYFKRPIIPNMPPQVWAAEIPNRGLTILGAYYFDSKFFDIFPHIEKSTRGEYEMASVINHYGSTKITQILPEEWADMGTPEGMKQVEVMENVQG